MSRIANAMRSTFSVRGCCFRGRQPARKTLRSDFHSRTRPALDSVGGLECFVTSEVQLRPKLLYCFAEIWIKGGLSERVTLSNVLHIGGCTFEGRICSKRPQIDIAFAYWFYLFHR